MATTGVRILSDSCLRFSAVVTGTVAVPRERLSVGAFYAGLRRGGSGRDRRGRRRIGRATVEAILQISAEQLAGESSGADQRDATWFITVTFEDA